MKNVLLLFIATLFSVTLNAQNDITIGLVVPGTEINDVKPDAYKILKSKLERMLTACGVSAYGGDFVMYPTVAILEENLIEGGIKNFFKVKIDLTLNVVNLTSRTLFSSETWPLIGTAERIKSDAVKNAFTQLKTTDIQFKSFIAQTKSKIFTYYEENKDAILSKATTLSSTGEYEKAIALLSSYPSQVSGYEEAQVKIREVYLKYIDANASIILNKARAAYATKNYEEAVDLAAQIAPESSQYKEAKKIIDEVRVTINKEQDAEKARAMKALEIAADVEKNRTNAIASIAKAYYSRNVVNYNIISAY